MADSIQVGVKVVLDQTGLQAQLNGILNNVKSQIQNALNGKTFYMKGLTIGLSNAKIAGNVSSIIQTAINKQLRATPIKLSSVSVDKGSLTTRAQQIGNQFAKQITKQINQGLYSSKTKINLGSIQIKSDTLNKQAAQLAKQFAQTFQAQLNASQIKFNPKITGNPTAGNTNGTNGAGNAGSTNANARIQQVNNLASAIRKVMDLYRSADQIINRMMNTDPTSGAFTKMNADLQASEQQIQRLSNVIDQARLRYANLFSGATGDVGLISLANKYDNAATKYGQDLQNLQNYTTAVRNQLQQLQQIYAQYEQARQKYSAARASDTNSSEAQRLLQEAQQLRAAADTARQAYNQMYGANGGAGSAQGAALQQILRITEQINSSRLRGVQIENQISKATEKVKLDYTNLLTKMQQFQNQAGSTLQNTSAGANLQSLIARTQEQLNTRNFSASGLAGLRQEFANIQSAAAGAASSTRTFGGSIADLASRAMKWFGVTQLIMQSINMIKGMISNVADLDKSMTELRKVTNESELAYDTFLQNAGSKATELGSTVKDVVDATGDFARLGYNLQDAFELSQTATTLQTVGDDINNIQDASDALIATMAAFKIEAGSSLNIVDKLNAVGNAFSISTGGLSEALKRSAAAMSVAGNSLEETLGLITAGK